MLDKNDFIAARKKFISDVLISYRIKNNLIQGELAEILGITQAVVSMYELGKHIPGKKNFAKIAKLFNKAPEELAQLQNTDPEEIFKQFENDFDLPSVKISIDLKKATLTQIFEELKNRNIITTLVLTDK